MREWREERAGEKYRYWERQRDRDRQKQTEAGRRREERGEREESVGKAERQTDGQGEEREVASYVVYHNRACAVVVHNSEQAIQEGIAIMTEAYFLSNFIRCM